MGLASVALCGAVPVATLDSAGMRQLSFLVVFVGIGAAWKNWVDIRGSRDGLHAALQALFPSPLPRPSSSERGEGERGERGGRVGPRGEQGPSASPLAQKIKRGTVLSRSPFGRALAARLWA